MAKTGDSPKGTSASTARVALEAAVAAYEASKQVEEARSNALVTAQAKLHIQLEEELSSFDDSIKIASDLYGDDGWVARRVKEMMNLARLAIDADDRLFKMRLSLIERETGEEYYKNEGLILASPLLVLKNALDCLSDQARELQLLALEHALNAEIPIKLREVTDTLDIAEKRKIVTWLNQQMRELDAAIAVTEQDGTLHPHILYAVPSRDASGRYTLESRKAKKRHGWYNSIKELWPIQVMKDTPRKEGLLEGRTKSDT